jgi:hypothetical protein
METVPANSAGGEAAPVDVFNVHMRAFQLPASLNVDSYNIPLKRSVYSVVVTVWGVSPHTLRTVKGPFRNALGALSSGSIERAQVSAVMRNMHNSHACSAEFTLHRLVAPPDYVKNPMFTNNSLVLCPFDDPSSPDNKIVGLYHVLVQRMLSFVLKDGRVFKGLSTVVGTNACSLEGMHVKIALDLGEHE